MTAILNAWRIISGVERRGASSLVDFRRRWAVKAPESLSVSVSFSEAGLKNESTLSPFCSASESELVDCILSSVWFAFLVFNVDSWSQVEQIVLMFFHVKGFTAYKVYLAEKRLIDILFPRVNLPLKKVH